MQKLVEYSNYISNSDPDYKVYTTYDNIYWGDFNNIDNAYYYNYDEFNIEKHIDVDTYVNNILYNDNKFLNNEDFFHYMNEAYTYIDNNISYNHLITTFDYYTVTYNFLRYNYLTNYNNTKKYSNQIKFSYIIDNYSYEYDITYRNYCEYINTWDAQIKNEVNIPFYIKILNDNVKLKLTTNQTIKFSYLSDNHKNYAIEKDSAEFDKVCYIKDVRLDRADNDYDYNRNLFNFIVTSNKNNENIKCEIGGNILSLLKQDLGLTSYKGFNKMDNNNNTLITYFSSFFKDNSYIYKADKLYIPLLDVSAYMYNNMFYGCKSLTYGPTLLFQNINNYTCNNMFSDCDNLSYLTLLTYNYDNEITNVISSHMFDNWINKTNNLNLKLNSNINNYDSRYYNYITTNTSNIIISYI